MRSSSQNSEMDIVAFYRCDSSQEKAIYQYGKCSHSKIHKSWSVGEIGLQIPSLQINKRQWAHSIKLHVPYQPQ